MSIGLLERRRGLINSAAHVPYDAEILYLKGGNKAWIDTGVIGNSDNMEIYVDFTAAQGFNSLYRQAIFGNFTKGFYASQAGWSFYQRYGSGEWAITAPTELQSVVFPLLTIGTRYELICGPYQRGRLKPYGSSSWTTDAVGGTKYGSYSTSPILLFVAGPYWIQNGSVTYPCAALVHALSIKKNGSLVRDFIPVRVGNDGCMYDKVTKQLFENAGSGSFTIGNDI